MARLVLLLHALHGADGPRLKLGGGRLQLSHADAVVDLLALVRREEGAVERVLDVTPEGAAGDRRT
eukprot:5985294-Prymnesium_polylepis.1